MTTGRRGAGARGTVIATRGGMLLLSPAGRVVRVANAASAGGKRRRFGNRVQVAPVVDRIERQIAEEDWRQAVQAIRDLARTLGVVFTGIDGGVRVSTEWFSGIDREDKDRFLGFVQVLQNLFRMVEPLALRAPYGRKDDRWPAWVETLRRELPWVQDLMRDESDASRHGKFLVIPLKGVHTTDDAVAALDEASSHIQGKFPEVLYGKVYVRKDLHPKGTYGSQHSGQVAGAYQAPTDTITISMYTRPDRNSVATLIHEFGHRYHTRFLKGDKREEFLQLSTVGDVHEEFFPLAERERLADEWVARSRSFRDDASFGSGGPVHLSKRAEFFFKNFPRDEFKAKVSPLSRRFTEGDESVVPNLREALVRSQFGGRLRVVDDAEHLRPVYASPYGETSWEENFAESFLAFCTGKPLPAALQRFMVSL